MSFPSGHTSVATSYATFLAGYLLYRLASRFSTTESKGRAELWALQSLVPLAVFAWPAYVGVGRVQDNRHRPVDVLGGFFVGFVSGCVALGRALLFVAAVERRHPVSSPPHTSSAHSMQGSPVLQSNPMSPIGIKGGRRTAGWA